VAYYNYVVLYTFFAACISYDHTFKRPTDEQSQCYYEGVVQNAIQFNEACGDLGIPVLLFYLHLVMVCVREERECSTVIE
jgi:hypothetical protein